MTLQPSVVARTPADGVLTDTAPHSAVSWSAIFAGATVATAVTLALTVFGSAIGLSSVSPMQDSGASANSVAIGAVVWLIVMQWASSAVGGYMAGRLRTRATGIHTDEAFFRDTAHGFVAWSVATILTVAIVASAGSTLLGAGARAVGGAASAAVQGASQAGASAGSVAGGSAALVDTLFRPAQPGSGGDAGEAKAEAGRILASSAANGQLAAGDRTYLAQMAASRTGISQADAEKRVDDMVNGAKAAADKARTAAEDARKASSRVAYFTFFSMLIGAFIASVAGALGGRLRDN